MLDEAGVGALRAEVLRKITAGEVTQVTVPIGATLEWMALRRGGRPTILRQLRWAGRQPFRAYQFEIDDGTTGTYTFIVPEDCGNLALMRREPSPIGRGGAQGGGSAQGRGST